MSVVWKDTNIFYNILCFLITENEKLFDRSDAKLYWRTVLHLMALLHHACSGMQAYAISLEIVDHPDEEIRKLHTFKAGFLTGWNFTFQAVFLLLAFVHDAYEWRGAQESPRAKKIAYWRDVIFQSLVVPYTLFVSTMFWSLYLYDRELVFPEVYDVILPWWFNHCVHTNISIIVLVETFLQARRWPTNLKLELILTSIVAVAYAVVYYSIYFFAHRWLYNIFGILTWWQVVLYQLLIWGSSYFFYYIQFPINRLIHGPQPEVVEETPQKTEVAVTKNGQDLSKNFEIGNMQKTETDAAFSSDNWSLKYRSLREKFENSRL